MALIINFFNSFPPCGSKRRRSNIVARTLGRNIVCLSYRQGHDSQSGIFRATGGELASVRNKEIFDIVGLSPLVTHTVARVSAHAAGPQVVGGRIRGDL